TTEPARFSVPSAARVKVPPRFTVLLLTASVPWLSQVSVETSAFNPRLPAPRTLIVWPAALVQPGAEALLRPERARLSPWVAWMVPWLTQFLPERKKVPGPVTRIVGSAVITAWLSKALLPAAMVPAVPVIVRWLPNVSVPDAEI